MLGLRSGRLLLLPYPARLVLYGVAETLGTIGQIDKDLGHNARHYSELYVLLILLSFDFIVVRFFCPNTYYPFPFIQRFLYYLFFPIEPPNFSRTPQ